MKQYMLSVYHPEQPGAPGAPSPTAKEYARWVSDAKREETRDRRVAGALEQLRAGKPLR